MKKLLCIHLFFAVLVLVTTPQVYSATVAEASVGHGKAAVGKYDVSSMTEEEKEWFITFLKGNFFADGWEEISSNILLNTVDHERESQQLRLAELGYKIGREWCRGNDIRKINTYMLKKWGRELKNTAADEPHLLGEVLQRIDSEVDELLN